jgi:hypothetical protein
MAVAGVAVAGVAVAGVAVAGCVAAAKVGSAEPRLLRRELRTRPVFTGGSLVRRYVPVKEVWAKLEMGALEGCIPWAAAAMVCASVLGVVIAGKPRQEYNAYCCFNFGKTTPVSI